MRTMEAVAARPAAGFCDSASALAAWRAAARLLRASPAARSGSGRLGRAVEIGPPGWLIRVVDPSRRRIAVLQRCNAVINRDITMLGLIATLIWAALRTRSEAPSAALDGLFVTRCAEFCPKG